jgi:hypothetical protein
MAPMSWWAKGLHIHGAASTAVTLLRSRYVLHHTPLKKDFFLTRFVPISFDAVTTLKQCDTKLIAFETAVVSQRAVLSRANQMVQS